MRHRQEARVQRAAQSQTGHQNTQEDLQPCHCLAGDQDQEDVPRLVVHLKEEQSGSPEVAFPIIFSFSSSKLRSKFRGITSSVQ